MKLILRRILHSKKTIFHVSKLVLAPANQYHQCAVRFDDRDENDNVAIMLRAIAIASDDDIHEGRKESETTKPETRFER